MFLGYVSRKHGDVDIQSYWEDRNSIISYMQSIEFEVYEMLGEEKAHHITDINNQRCIKRNIFCVKKDCDLVQLSLTDEKDIYIVAFNHIEQSKFNFLEFLFNKKDDSYLYYARNRNIKRKLNITVLYHDDIPYLAPEICLLYKSSDIERDGYQQDYALTIKKMSDEQQAWFDNALRYLYPDGHKWRKS